MTDLGIVTGIIKEAEILSDSGLFENAQLRCSGANSKKAYEQASELAQKGSRILVSFGIAGGIDPSLRAGDLLLPNTVTATSGEVYEVDRSHRLILNSHLTGILQIEDGSLLGVDTVISEATGKKKLYQETGTVAVDMESLGVAKAAQENNLPFIVIRAISDTADQNIPKWALKVVDEEGCTKIGPILYQMARNPNSIPSLIHLGTNSRKAFKKLRRVATLGFGF